MTHTEPLNGRVPRGRLTSSIRAWMLACLLAPLLAGCGSFAEKPTEFKKLPANVRARPLEYIIQSGDEIDFKFRHTPELDLLVQVRPDGGISMPIVGDVRAAGQTVEELRAQLVERYAGELNRPEIAIVMRSFAAYQVHVGGEVGAPGVYPMVRPTTVLDAVFAAGSFLPTARENEVIIIRRVPGRPKHIVVPVDLVSALDGSDPKQNIALLPYDIVYVPRSAIADVNLWVDQYIRQNIPINFTLQFGDLTGG